MKRGKQMIGMAAAAAAALFVLGGCQSVQDDVIVLKVANWEEYIDEGGWDDDEVIELDDGTQILGTQSLVEDFEDWYYETYGQKVIVEYSTFGTNEDLYNQLTIGDTFDLVCPSEYMIMKLLDEDELQPFSEQFSDTGIEENYYARGISPYIQGRLAKMEMDGSSLSDYAACYMWGTLGIVYNPQEVSAQEVSDWNILRNTDYKKRITAKDSVRDCYFAAASMICQDEVSSEEFRARSDYEQALSDKINDTSTETVEQIEEILTEVKENAFSFETDSGKADLVTGKVIANLQWSGDAVYSMQQAAEDGMTLKYAVPEACTNLWFDGWCMLKKGIGGDTKKQQAAEAFINYLSKPESAIRNMYYIGYTSAIAGGDSDLIYEYLDWCYGTEDEDAVEYPLGYFFSGDQADGDYVLLTEEEQLDGELFAQYPTMDVINRSVVMAYFEPEANARISQMWINVRCYEFPFINK